MNRTYGVYVKTDEQSRIVDVNSSVFITENTEWLLIDEGNGIRYLHAQGNYFPKPLYDERGIPQYKLVDSQPIERTHEEMDADYVEPEPVPDDGITGRVVALEERLAAYEEAYAQGVNDA